jgi:hypothetical protein
MRREPDFFEEVEVELVYIAKKLADALAVEELLTSLDVDYLVETSEYHSGVIFRTLRAGAFFYVHPERTAYARQALEESGRRPQQEPG